MSEWKPLELQDKQRIDQALKSDPLPLSDYSFTNLWMWNQVRSYQIASIDSFICIKYGDIFLYPLGKGSRNAIIKKLIKENPPFTMRAIPENAGLEIPLIPEPMRFDYIYLYEDLLNLPGNAYQPKRNLIHQFTSHYAFEYRKIDQALIPQIQEMEKQWFDTHEKKNLSVQNEHEAILHVLNDFAALDTIGGALLVEGQVIAYTLAEYITPDMLVIHIEKALTAYKGAYQMIQAQFLSHSTPVMYVNREEDLGIPNLIKIKESYHPIRFEKKYRFTSY